MKNFILWDNDGVLVDTEKWYFEANKKALGDLGFTISESEYMHIMQNGLSVWEVAEAKSYSSEIIQKQREKRDEYYQDFLKTEDLEIPHVIDILTELKKIFSMAIITTSKRKDFELIHRDRSITDFMEFCLVREDYELAKPHPMPYLIGVERFNANPDECIVVEDSARGLKAAIAASIDCVILKHEFTKSHDFSCANYFADHISELPKLLNTINNQQFNL